VVDVGRDERQTDDADREVEDEVKDEEGKATLKSIWCREQSKKRAQQRPK